MATLEINEDACSVLSTTDFDDRGCGHALTLCSLALRRAATPPTYADAVDVWLTLLVDRPKAAGSGASILWAYVWTDNKLSRPQTRLLAQAVWGAARGRVYVVTSEVVGNAAYRIRVHGVDPTATLRAFPVSADLDEVERWTEASKPLGQIRIVTHEAVDQLAASIEGDVIDIRGRCYRPVLIDGKPAYEHAARLTYDVGTAAWSEVRP